MKDSQKQQKKKRLFKKSKSSVTALPSTGKQLSGNKKSSPLLRISPFSFLKNKKSQQTDPVSNTPEKRARNSFSIKHRESTISLFIVPLILCVLLGIIYVLNIRSSGELKKTQLSISLDNQIAAYPVVDAPLNPYLSAKAAIVIDSGTKKVIFSKNHELRFSMASTAKIMTALVALDYYSPDSVLLIKSNGVEGSVVGLVKGEKYYFDDLLYAMLLPSANDAAVAIVDNYPGGKTAFIAKMNQKAKDWFLTNTLFSDPTGLDDDGNFTTVGDLARLSVIAMKEKVFAERVGTQQKIITNVSGTRQLSLYNLNRLLGYNGVNGVKTGTTEGAGEVLVTSTVQNGHSFIIVVMNSQDRFADTGVLLNYISNNVRFVEPQFASEQ